MGEQIAFPATAAQTLRQINERISELEAARQNYLAGLFAGLGVEAENQNVRVDFAAMTYTITPPNEQEGA